MTFELVPVKIRRFVRLTELLSLKNCQTLD